MKDLQFRLNTAEWLLKQALDLLNDRPSFGLRSDPGRTSYKLASKIDEYFRLGGTNP